MNLSCAMLHAPNITKLKREPGKMLIKRRKQNRTDRSMAERVSPLDDRSRGLTISPASLAAVVAPGLKFDRSAAFDYLTTPGASSEA